jgi:hypothetical protein
LNRTSIARTVVGASGVAATLGIAFFGVSSYQACAVYNSSLIGSPDGGSASSQDSDGPACMHAEPPPRPTDDDGGGPQNTMVVAAFNTIDIGVSGGLDAGIPPFGYDLDHVCTCPGPSSCIPQAGAEAGISFCDDEAGRDNTDIQLFRGLPGTASTGTSEIDQGLAAGQYGSLVVISNYNGNADDSQVTVDFYVSNGLSRNADGGIPTPQLNGNDVWTIDPSSVVGGQEGAPPVYSDETAWVSNYTVVANMAQLKIAFGERTFLGGATMQLYGAILVGKLYSYPLTDGGSVFGYGLSGGTIAGRWPTSQILSTLAYIPEEGGGFLCGPDSLNYNIVRAVVCENADIQTLSQEDNMGAPCDAISVGMQFTAVPAKLGGILALPPAPSGCRDGGTLWSDTCSPP